jgi:dTDP-4-dehydrorhamnose reductase
MGLPGDIPSGPHLTGTPRRPVLVVGASGLLGAYLHRSFERAGPVIGTGHEQGGGELASLDVRDEQAVRAVIAECDPGVVVCAAAVSNVERCEIDPDWSRDINVEGTLVLARASRAARATFVFLSSEYVFDGLDGPYDESAPLNPLNEYGRQKVAVERALPDVTAGDFVIARVSCLYGHETKGKNFVYQLWAALTEGREFPAPGDQVGTPTAAANAADVIRALVTRGRRGTFHVAGPEPMLRSDFALLAARQLGLDPGLVRPTPTAELGLVAARPTGAGLVVRHAQAASGLGLWPVRDGIRAMLGERPIRAWAPGAV